MAKQKSLKKTIKSNKKKSKGLKNLDFKKNWMKLAYGGALALLLFTSVGFGGYTYVSNKNLEAKAAGYTTLAGWRNGSTLKACKVAITSTTGPRWKIKLVAKNPLGTNEKVGYGFYVERGTSLVSTTTFPLLNPGASSYKTAYASRTLNDTYSVAAGNGGMGGGGPFAEMLKFSTITGC